MKCLNVGCGSRFHPHWINIDWVSCNPHVLAHDLSTGIPYPEQTFDVVYHSHILEHFTKQAGFFFLQECYRVLKVGGVIRIAVPDLEQIVRMYLLALEKASQGEAEWEYHYDWMVLELYDQAVRTGPGGDMRAYLDREFIPNEGFVCKRLGGEARRIIEACRIKESQEKIKRPRKSNKRTFTAGSLLHFIRQYLVKILLGEKEYQALELGQFRLGGEVHQCMYDRYSLSKLLAKVGFQNVKPLGPRESQIPDWTAFSLDTEPDGRIYKPDSFYMEGVRCAEGGNDFKTEVANTTNVELSHSFS